MKIPNQGIKALMFTAVLASVSCANYQPETTSKYVVLSATSQRHFIELVDQRPDNEKNFLKTGSGSVFLGDQNFQPDRMELLKSKLGQLLREVQIRHPIVVTSFKVEVKKVMNNDVSKTENSDIRTEYWKPIMEPDQREIAFVVPPHDAPYEPLSKLPRENSQAAISYSPDRREDAPPRQDDPKKEQHEVPLPPRDNSRNDRRDKHMVHDKRRAHNSGTENESSSDRRGRDRRSDRSTNTEPGNHAGIDDQNTTPVESGRVNESGNPPQTHANVNEDSWGSTIYLLLAVLVVAVFAFVVFDVNKDKRFATVSEISVRYGEENISITESNVYPAAKLATGVGENTVSAIRSVANRISDIESKNIN